MIRFMTVAIAVLVFAMATPSIAQTPAAMQAAIKSQDKAVRAIHTYPSPDYCHTTHVTAVVVSGTKITITEKWTLQSLFSTANHSTTLTGTISGDVASGTWSATTGSSGRWSYDFQKGAGTWNKPTGGPFAITSNEMQPLVLQIVDANDVLDRLGQCPAVEPAVPTVPATDTIAWDSLKATQLIFGSSPRENYEVESVTEMADGPYSVFAKSADGELHLLILTPMDEVSVKLRVVSTTYTLTLPKTTGKTFLAVPTATEGDLSPTLVGIKFTLK
jgi:hypothetical protein